MHVAYRGFQIGFSIFDNICNLGQKRLTMPAKYLQPLIVVVGFIFWMAFDILLNSFTQSPFFDKYNISNFLYFFPK